MLVVVQLAEPSLASTIVRTARETADRAVFEELSVAAADLARALGDRAPAELVALAAAEFPTQEPDDAPPAPEPPDA